MSRPICLFSLFVGVLSIATLAGCGQSGSSIAPELLAKLRDRLTLTDEPDGAQVVPEVRHALLGISDDHDHADHDHADHEHAEHSEEDDHEHADDDHKGENGAAEGEEGEDSHDDHADHDHEGHDDDADHEHADHDAAHEHAEHEHAEHEHSHAVTHATEPMEVVLVGQIGGLANPWKETQPDFPFARNQAAFFLADPVTVVENEASGHVHASGEECAFCEAHATDRSAMLAMIRFLDENGDVLPVDVRELFDIKESDTVVIQGKARVIEGGMMVVDATGIYLR